MATELPVIAIIGPTASGKTTLAIELAEYYNGEIICADSRTVYKGLDVGTAKPTAAEQKRVPHWGIDLVEPNEPFSAADFQAYANHKINEIRARGKVPFIVGGTGLYVDSVLYNFTFGLPADEAERVKLEAMSFDELYSYCSKHNVTLPENRLNKRHIVRAIERKSISDIGKTSLQQNSFIVGIATNMDTLRTRIISRTEQLFENDVVGEATMLGEKYGWESRAMTGNIYPLVKSYLEGEQTLEQIKDKYTTLDYQLAKRQMTWFRRNSDIMWADITGAKAHIQSLLARE